MRFFPWIFALIGFLFSGYFAIWQKQILDLGFSIQQFSLLILAQTVVALFVDIPSGALADRFGYKLLSFFGSLICIYSFFIPVIFPSAWGMSLAVLGLGMGEAFINGALDSWKSSLSQSASLQARKASFFKREMWSGTGKVIGAIVIPGITSLLGEQVRVSWILFTFVSVYLTILILVAPESLLRDRAPQIAQAGVDPSLSMKDLLVDPFHSLFLLGTFLVGGSDGIVSISLWPRLQALGMTWAISFGLFQAGLTLARMIGIQLYQRFDRTGEKVDSQSGIKVALPLLLGVPFFFAFAFAQSPGYAVFLWFIRIVAISAYYPYLKERITSGKWGFSYGATLLSTYSVAAALGAVTMSGLFYLFSHGMTDLQSWILLGASLTFFGAGAYYVGSMEFSLRKELKLGSGK